MRIVFAPWHGNWHAYSRTGHPDAGAEKIEELADSSGWRARAQLLIQRRGTSVICTTEPSQNDGLSVSDKSDGALPRDAIASVEE
jgi:hypothetical protein